MMLMVRKDTTAMHLSVLNQYGHRITTRTNNNSDINNVVRMDHFLGKADTATTIKVLIDVARPFYDTRMDEYEQITMFRHV